MATKQAFDAMIAKKVSRHDGILKALGAKYSAENRPLQAAKLKAGMAYVSAILAELKGRVFVPSAVSDSVILTLKTENKKLTEKLKENRTAIKARRAVLKAGNK